mgnify:CR=1 FL=1
MEESRPEAARSKISVVLPVLTPTPFLRAMTEFAVKTLRAHADNPFELIIVEALGGPTGVGHFDPHIWEGARGIMICEDRKDQVVSIRADKYLLFNPKIGAVREFNAGADLATGDFVLSTGNDVIVPPHWDTELLRVFENNADCGVASLSAFEPGAVIGPGSPQECISQQPEVGVVECVEGMYSPFMAWRRGWRMDEAYRKIYCDSDFVMRVYQKGQRAYRSCRAHVHHLLRMTSDRVGQEQHRLDLAQDERLFYQRWGKSRLMIMGLIRGGHWQYGREHLSFTAPINLHYKAG